MYSLFLGGVQYPTPPKLTVKVKGQNKTMSLLDGGTFTFLRSPGLTEITLPLTLTMLGAEHKPDYYLSHLADFMENKKPLRFVLTRISPAGELLYDTNMLMSLEDYTATEDAKNGLDVDVDISLKRYMEHKTITAEIEEIPTENVNNKSDIAEVDTTSSKVFIPGTLANRISTSGKDTEAFKVRKGTIVAAVSNTTASAASAASPAFASRMGGGSQLITAEKLLSMFRM